MLYCIGTRYEETCAISTLDSYYTGSLKWKYHIYSNPRWRFFPFIQLGGRRGVLCLGFRYKVGGGACCLQLRPWLKLGVGATTSAPDYVCSPHAACPLPCLHLSAAAALVLPPTPHIHCVPHQSGGYGCGIHSSGSIPVPGPGLELLQLLLPGRVSMCSMSCSWNHSCG